MSQLRTYYKVKTKYSNYYVEVFKQYPNSDKVYFGGKQKCVVISVYFDNQNPNLDAVGYNEDCNIAANLERQIGTKHMVLCAFAFVKKMYGKEVSELFELKDVSFIKCANKYHMPLSHHSLMHHNKAWYERVFDAVPCNKHKHEYTQKVETWKKLKKTKPNMSIYFGGIRSNPQLKLVTQLYKQSKSLEDFFRKVRSGDCIVYRDWGETFVNAHFNSPSGFTVMGMEWVINASNLEKPEIEIINKGNTKPADMFIHTGGGVLNFLDDRMVL